MQSSHCYSVYLPPSRFQSLFGDGAFSFGSSCLNQLQHRFTERLLSSLTCLHSVFLTSSFLFALGKDVPTMKGSCEKVGEKGVQGGSDVGQGRLCVEPARLGKLVGIPVSSTDLVGSTTDGEVTVIGFPRTSKLPIHKPPVE